MGVITPVWVNQSFNKYETCLFKFSLNWQAAFVVFFYFGFLFEIYTIVLASGFERYFHSYHERRM